MQGREVVVAPRRAQPRRARRVTAVAALVAGLAAVLGASSCSTHQCENYTGKICYYQKPAVPVPDPPAAPRWNGWPGAAAAGPVTPALHATVAAPEGAS